VVSGVAIGYAPGEGGEPADRFEGLDQAPFDSAGRQGDPLLVTRPFPQFHSRRQPSCSSTGKPSAKSSRSDSMAIRVSLAGVHQSAVRLASSVVAPAFGNKSGYGSRFASGGITANLAPLSTLLAGGRHRLGGRNDQCRRSAKPGGNNGCFRCYSSHKPGAANRFVGPTVRTNSRFDGDAGVTRRDFRGHAARISNRRSRVHAIGL